MKIVVETNEENTQREETIIINRGNLGTATKIVLVIRGVTYYLDPTLFEGLL